MNWINSSKSVRQNRHKLWVPAALVVLLASIATLPQLGNRFDIEVFSQLGNPGDVALLCTLGLAFSLGVTVMVLSSRLRRLEAVRNVDNHAAMHDPLTGAANRRQFEQTLDEVLASNSPAHALLMLDLDRFKPINDLYGHAAGDALLKDITMGLRRLVPHGDLVARLGGDEFALIIRSQNDAMAEQIALDVLQFVTRFRLSWEGQRLHVGASIGLVHINQPSLSAAALMTASDDALYAAKESGRGAIFSASVANNNCTPTSFKQVNCATSEPVSSAKSHEPQDGRNQVLHGTLMSALDSSSEQDRRRTHGARRRHDVQHWVNVEPLTMGDKHAPGMGMHELLADAAARNDGGADFARWVMAMALDSASRLSHGQLGRLGFVLPIPARALVVVPTLADELMRDNALAYLPIRHICFVLHGVDTHCAAPELKNAQQRFVDTGVTLAYELQANTLEALAPLHHLAFAELHIGRQIIAKLKPGKNDSATLDALLAIVNNSNTSLVAPNVSSTDELRQLQRIGVARVSGAAIAQPAPLHNVLQNINSTGPGMTPI